MIKNIQKLFFGAVLISSLSIVATSMDDAKAKAADLAGKAGNSVLSTGAYLKCMACCLTDKNRNECEQTCKIAALKEELKAKNEEIAKKDEEITKLKASQSK